MEVEPIRERLSRVLKTRGHDKCHKTPREFETLLDELIMQTTTWQTETLEAMEVDDVPGRLARADKSIIDPRKTHA